MPPQTQPRIIYFGTPAAATIPLGALLQASYQVVAVVTQPDRPFGRHGTPTPSPVKTFAQAHGLAIWQPERSRDLAVALASSPADVGVLFSYGNILPTVVLEAFAHGILNLHPSLLPRYRGPSPVQQAILDGVAETGVTIIRLDEQLDHGPIVASAPTTIGPAETAAELLDRLVALGSQKLLEVLPRYLRGELKPVPQVEAAASWTKALQREDGQIDWQATAVQLYRQWRAYQPWPGAFTRWGPRRLKIITAAVGQATPPGLPPGTVVEREGRLLVACSQGALELESVQLQGGQVQPAAAFVRGHPTFVGARLG